MMEKNEGEWRFEMAVRAHKTKENGVKVDDPVEMANGKDNGKKSRSTTIYS